MLKKETLNKESRDRKAAEVATPPTPKWLADELLENRRNRRETPNPAYQYHLVASYDPHGSNSEHILN